MYNDNREIYINKTAKMELSQLKKKSLQWLISSWLREKSS